MLKHSPAFVRRLAEIRGSAPRSAPNTRTLAAFAGHTSCQLARAGFAAGVDFDRLLVGTRYQAPFGQSPFAFSRGIRFQDLIAERGYAATLALLQQKMGFQTTEAQISDLRRSFPATRQGMILRAHETRSLIAKIIKAAPDATNLIDGAVLKARIGGVEAYFEADALAARFGGLIHAGEIKSFPVVDGKADPEKLGSALDQVAIYIWLVCQLVEELGGDPTALVSSVAMLITPKNVGLTPTLSIQNVSRRITRLGRLLVSVPDAGAVLSLLPAGAGFGEIADRTIDPERRVDALHSLADQVGTDYKPDCLSNCGNAIFCRERAFQQGAPCVSGPQIVRLLPGVRSLTRAAELTNGAPPNAVEGPAAELLARAGRLYNASLPQRKFSV